MEASNWKEQLYKRLQIDGLGMLQEVLLRVGAELAKLPSPKTKTPIILVEILRETTAGADMIKSTFISPRYLFG